MMRQLIVTNKAIKDIEIAKKWYDEQQENLGNQFTDVVFKSIEFIKQRLLSFPNKYRYTREMYIKKYPYLIIFSVEEEVVFRVCPYSREFGSECLSSRRLKPIKLRVCFYK